MEPRLSLITLGVRDLDRSVSFYRDGLGWKRSSVGEATGEVAFFQAGGCIVALWPRESLPEDAGISSEGSGFTGFALAHNVRTREEVDEVLRTAQEAGGRLVRPGVNKDWGGYAGYFP